MRNHVVWCGYAKIPKGNPTIPNMRRVCQALQSARSHMCVDYCGLGLSVSGLRNHRGTCGVPWYGARH